MSMQSLTRKLLDNPNVQVVLSKAGEPSYLQIPWDVVLELDEGELETLDILADREWKETLSKRLNDLEEDPDDFLRDAVTLKEYRAKKKV